MASLLLLVLLAVLALFLGTLMILMGVRRVIFALIGKVQRMAVCSMADEFNWMADKFN